MQVCSCFDSPSPGQFLSQSILCMLLRSATDCGGVLGRCGGGTLLILTRLIPLPQAAHAVFEGLDVYLFLTGMMIFWLNWRGRKASSTGWPMWRRITQENSPGADCLVLIYLVGTLVTALLSNDATAVVSELPLSSPWSAGLRLIPSHICWLARFIANAASFVFFQFPIQPTSSSLTSTCRHLGCGCAFFLLPSSASILLTFLCLRWVFTQGTSWRNAGAK